MRPYWTLFSSYKLKLSLLLLLIGSLIRPLPLSSQSLSIDSLIYVYENEANDSLRLATLNLLIYEYTDVETLKAVEYGHIMLAEAMALNDSIWIGHAYNRLAAAYHSLGRLSEALDYGLKGLKVFESIQFQRGLDNIYNSLAVVYDEQGDDEKSLYYYQKNLEFGRRNNLPGSTVNALGNIGDFLIRRDEPEKALKYLIEAELIAGGNDLHYEQVICLNNLALAYEALREDEKAISLIERSAEKRIEWGFKDLALEVEYDITKAKILTRRGLFNEALRLLKHGKETCEIMHSLYYLKWVYETYAEVYAQMGDYKNAYQYHQRFFTIHDSMYDAESAQKISQLQQQFESEKQQAQIDLLNKDKMLKEEELSRQRAIRNGFVISSFFFLIMVLILVRNNQIKQKVNKILYAQRNEMGAQRDKLQTLIDEVNKQKAEIEMQRDRVSLQSDIIERKNIDITASISYAQRIQSALLPEINVINWYLPQAFVFLKPRDIVSGDFYWFQVKTMDDGSEKLILAIVDCTGHGVPGAFMSLIGNSLLNRIVTDRNIIEPSAILEQMDKEVRLALKQDHSDNRDGMEMGVCLIDKKAKEMRYAGARHNLLFFQNGEARTIRGDRQSIGDMLKQNETQQHTFTTHYLSLEKPCTFYMYTDGFQDQFGGKQKRKFMAPHFKHMLTRIHAQPFSVQKDLLETTLKEWMGEEAQVDDILIFGAKIE